MTKKKQNKKASKAKKPKKHMPNRKVGGGAPRPTTIPFARTRRPRPFQNMATKGDIVTVTGFELLDAITITAGPVDRYFLLNAGNSQYFKRLSAVQSGYEKFRFRKIQLQWYPECPATRSGLVSAALLTDPLVAPPTDPQAYMAYKESFTGPIYDSLDAVNYNPVDPKWYYASSATTVDATDPTTRFQGRVCWQSRGCVSADAGLLAGYLGIHYTCEMTDPRPMHNAVLVMEGLEDQKFTGSAGAAVQIADILNCEGVFDCDATTVNEQKEGYASGVLTNDSWSSTLFDHMLNYYFPIDGVTVDGKELEHKNTEPRPEVRLFRTKRGKPWQLTVGSAVQKAFPKWCELWQVAPSEDEKDSLLRFVDLADLKPERSYYLRSNTAGDVSVIIKCWGPDGSVEVIDTKVTSSGTGALTLTGSVSWTETVPNCRLGVVIAPTGSENRLLGADARFGYQDCNESQFA